MKLLITDGAGFVSSHAAEYFANKDYDVVWNYNYIHSQKWRIKWKQNTH